MFPSGNGLVSIDRSGAVDESETRADNSPPQIDTVMSTSLHANCQQDHKSEPQSYARRVREQSRSPARPQATKLDEADPCQICAIVLTIGKRIFLLQLCCYRLREALRQDSELLLSRSTHNWSQQDLQQLASTTSSSIGDNHSSAESNSSSTETLKWLGSMSDVSVASHATSTSALSSAATAYRAGIDLSLSGMLMEDAALTPPPPGCQTNAAGRSVN
uniref:Uncharacterized protein n=1 Tax=Anopheles atroparvus TaxID=41427 RepID=A0A182JCL0_ANOAO